MSKKIVVALGLLMALVTSQAVAMTLPRLQFPAELPAASKSGPGINRRLPPMEIPGHRLQVGGAIKRFNPRDPKRQVMPEAVRRVGG